MNNDLNKILMIALEQTADHVMVTDTKGVIEYVNRAFEQTTGYCKREVLGKRPQILKSGHHGEVYYSHLWKTILSGRVFRANTINKKKNGEIYFADQTITPLKNDQGEIISFISVWKDSTQRIRQEEAVMKAHERLALEKKKLEELIVLYERINLIDSLDDLINCVIYAISNILESKRCSIMFLEEGTEYLTIRGAIGLDNKDIMRHQVRLGESVAGMVAQNKKPILVEVIDKDKRINRKNLPGYKTQSFLSVPMLFDHELLGVINVTEKNSTESEIYTELDLKILMSIGDRVSAAISKANALEDLKKLTVTDSLTELFNRRYFTSSLLHEIKRADRTKEDLCLIIMDVDDFKKYNDKFGHPAGDEYLKAIGKVLKDNLRDMDISCRYAGDEFVVILPATTIAQAEITGRKILQKIRSLNMKMKVSCSMGIAAYRSGMSEDAFLECADHALYEAKEQGRDQIKIDG